MEICTLTTTKAFISIESGEIYPDTITVKVDRTRKFKKMKCSFCNTIFYARRYSEFCSTKCFSLKNGADFICAYCKKEFTRPASDLKGSKSKLYFCSRKCKDLAQRIESDITEIHPSHYGTGKYSYSDRGYRIQKEKYGNNFCEECGEKDELFLVVHHIDYNRANNVPKNLKVLCANCHIKKHRLGL